MTRLRLARIRFRLNPDADAPGHHLRLRLFRRQRAFFATAALTIALGVGLTATVFAIVDGVIFRRLPYRDPARLVAVYGAVRAEDQRTMTLSVPELLDSRAASRSCEQLERYHHLGIPPAHIRGADEVLFDRQPSRNCPKILST